MNITLHDNRTLWNAREAERSQRIKALRLPDYTLVEEILNSATHALGAALGLIGFLLCMRILLPVGNFTATASMAFFCTTLIMLYTNSALYHGWGLTQTKKYLQVLDHCTIFLLISGTYAPFTLMVIGGALGWGIFAVVLAASVVGIVLNLIDMKKYRVISMICYLLTGWCIIFAYGSIRQALSTDQLLLLIGGGVAYTVGAALYGLGVKVRYMHTVWHFFVLAGSLLHFLCLYRFILG